jgi:phospholipid/cholesterol/gamma-HCH transport system substrate-binding protein
MRSRTIREGSVGLLILVGIGLFGFLMLWLKGINPGKRSYNLTLEFDNTTGMQTGTPVLYRGVPVGRVLTIAPKTNSIEVEIEITQSGLRIPAGVVVETSQSGLIGETSIAITPLSELADANLAMSPVGRDCNSQVILCDGDRLEGKVGVNYEDLLKSAERISEFLADPKLAQDILKILTNTSEITDNVIDLSAELTLVAKDVRQEVSPLAASARRSTDSITQAASQIETSATQTAENLNITLAEVNSLLSANRSNIVSTLDNVEASSASLRQILATLGPQLENNEFLANLETLSANAVAASEDLKEVSASLNSPENLVLLQQTLESARDVFQSAQKIMADVDELTGDPTFRTNIRNLVNGLGNLVSTTERLETQTQLAHILENTAASTVEANEANGASDPAAASPTATPSETLSETLPVAATSVEQPSLVQVQSDQPPLVLTDDSYPVLVYDGVRYSVRMAARPQGRQP